MRVIILSFLVIIVAGCATPQSTTSSQQQATTYRPPPSPPPAAPPPNPDQGAAVRCTGLDAYAINTDQTPDKELIINLMGGKTPGYGSSCLDGVKFDGWLNLQIKQSFSTTVVDSFNGHIAATSFHTDTYRGGFGDPVLQIVDDKIHAQEGQYLDITGDVRLDATGIDWPISASVYYN
jgi:hypothetical protein